MEDEGGIQIISRLPEMWCQYQERERTGIGQTDFNSRTGKTKINIEHYKYPGNQINLKTHKFG